MKIEFRKVPLQAKEFCLEHNSVKFLGTFSKISSKLVNIDSKIKGSVEVNCCKCGKNFDVLFDEEVVFLVTDGIYSSDDERDFDKVIIEAENSIIDFEEILQSELESFCSDYHICDNCAKSSKAIDIEY